MIWGRCTNRKEELVLKITPPSWNFWSRSVSSGWLGMTSFRFSSNTNMIDWHWTPNYKHFLFCRESQCLSDDCERTRTSVGNNVTNDISSSYTFSLQVRPHCLLWYSMSTRSDEAPWRDSSQCKNVMMRVTAVWDSRCAKQLWVKSASNETALWGPNPHDPWG